MRPLRRYSRILILCFLTVSVFAPIFLLSYRLKHIKADGKCVLISKLLFFYCVVYFVIRIGVMLCYLRNLIRGLSAFSSVQYLKNILKIYLSLYESLILTSYLRHCFYLFE